MSAELEAINRATVRVLDVGALPPPQLRELAGMSLLSQQDAATRQLADSAAASARIVTPPYDPSKLFVAYNSDPDIAAAVDALAWAVVGGGVVVKPADATDALGPSGAEDYQPISTPDLKQRARLKAFLDAPNFDLSVTFSSLNFALMRDVLVTGQAYPAFGRPGSGQPVSSASYLSSAYMRRAEDPRLFYRVSGQKYEPYRYIGADEVAVSQGVSIVHAGQKLDLDVVLALKPRDPHRSPNDVAAYTAGVDGLSGFDVGWVDAHGEAVAAATTVADELDVQSIPEVGFLAFQDPLNDYYGRPPLLPALLDHVLIRSIGRYNRAFFDNNTVPPLAIVTQGEGVGDEGMKVIQDTLARRGAGASAAHKTLLLEVGQDVDVQIHKLESERQHEGHFLELQGKSGRRVFAVLRVPYSYVNQDAASSEGVLKEAVRIFMAGVVQPLREWLAAFWNRVLREHMGITDWKIAWRPVEAEDLATRVQMWERLLLRGVISINEVRRELGLRAQSGADDLFLTIQGTGVVLIDLLRQIGQRTVTNEPKGDLLPGGGAKTPARGASPVLTPGGS